MSAYIANQIRLELRQHPNNTFIGTQADLASAIGVHPSTIASALRWARDHCSGNRWTVTFHRIGHYRLIENFSRADIQALIEANRLEAEVMFGMAGRRTKQLDLAAALAPNITPAQRQTINRAIGFLSGAEWDLLNAST